MGYIKKVLLKVLFVLISYFNYAQSTISSKEAIILKNIRSNPEMVQKLVREILNSNEKLADTSYANMYIYYGFTHYQLNNPDSALYSYQKSLNYAEKYPRHKAKVYLNLGMLYRRLTKYDTALKYLLQSEVLHNEVQSR